MRISIYIVGLSLSALGGCAAKTPEADAVLSDPTRRSRSAVIKNVPFIDQTAGYCGPASLAMVLSWMGHPVSVEGLAEQVYTPGMSGSLQNDLLGAARRQGTMAVTIQGMEALLSEITAGHPVIVFENLSVRWAPRWHYAVVYGYDLSHEQVILHSGHEAAKHWDLRRFERSWSLGDFWGLVVLPAGELAATASEAEQAKTAAALEGPGHFFESEKAYDAILERWPGDLVALVGRANRKADRDDLTGARKDLETAALRHPESAVARENLRLVTEALKKTPALR